MMGVQTPAFASHVGISDRENLSWLNVGIRRHEIWFAVSHTATGTHTGRRVHCLVNSQMYFLP
jgi:hypothetical protein